jgi:hypothetical protein
MNRILAGILAAAVLGAVGLFFGGRLLSGAPASESAESEEVTYICRETGELVRGSRDEPPEVGGCQELVQALYCPQCQKWYPFPPPEVLRRMPRGPECPKHRSGLLEEIPETENEIAQQE